MKRIKYLGCLLVLGILAGCSDDDLPDYYRLGALRILAIKAGQSEVNPTSGPVSVSITPIVSDIAGAGRTLSYELQTCHDPGVGAGASPNCDHDPAKTSTSGTFTLTAPRFTEEIASSSVSVPADVFDGRSAADRYNGVPYLVVFSVTGGGETVRSFRRIIATERTPLNAVADITSINSGGVAITALPTAKAKLTPVINGTAETFTAQRADGSLESRTESLTVTWFIPEGEMKFSRTDSTGENEYTPPASPTGSLFLATVLRDSRGGVSFKVVGP